MKTIKETIVNLLLTIVAIVCFLASYGFCDGTVIGSMRTILLLTITTGATIILGYRINK